MKKGHGKNQARHSIKGQKHVGPHTHQVHDDMPEGGGNLKLKRPTQSVTIAPMKDKMAGNVGGSKAHQAVQGENEGFGPSEPMMYSSGHGVKKGKVRKGY